LSSRSDHKRAGDEARIASQTIAEIKPTNDRYSDTENRSCQATDDTVAPPQQRADDRASR